MSKPLQPILEAPARPAEPADGALEIRRLFELSHDLFATIGADGRFTSLNPSWEHTLGWTRSELMSRPAVSFIHPDDLDRTLALAGGSGSEASEFENRYRCRDGSYRWLQWNALKQRDSWYGVARDVTERKIVEEQSLGDPLTGLPNRVVFVDRLARTLARLQRGHGQVAVFFVDIDRFKVINDGKGHEVGDCFLRAVAARLRETLRGADTVARFGGDEFVILIEDGLGARDLAEIGRRLVHALGRPFTIAGEELTSSTSVGIATSRAPDAKAETLLREADVAMYRAKARGGGRFEIFDDAVRAEVERRVRVQSELRRAIERGQLRVYYPPIVALPEMSITRCEALARWAHPERGLLLPDEFVPLAEETGLILPIGEWVLREACRQAQEWRRSGKDLGITVNVSTRQLADPALADIVRAALGESGLPAASLCLEITETAIMESPERVAPSLAGLRRLGVRIAMDDFGSGYSSLTYLKTLPLDLIKIDRSFVAGLPTCAEDRAIVAAILHLARETELSVIAEGVETPALHAELVGLGCELAQGFLYDRPKPAEELAVDGYSSRVRAGAGDPLVIREFMRQIGIPARIRP